MTLHTGSGFIIILCASLRDTSRPCDTHPAVRAHRDTHLFFFFCSEKEVSLPSMSVYSIIPPAAIASVFIKRNGLCDRRRSHLFTILLITVQAAGVAKKEGGI